MVRIFPVNIMFVGSWLNTSEVFFLSWHMKSVHSCTQVTGQIQIAVIFGSALSGFESWNPNPCHTDGQPPYGLSHRSSIFLSEISALTAFSLSCWIVAVSVSPGLVSPFVEIRRSQFRLVSTTWILILIRYLYIASDDRLQSNIFITRFSITRCRMQNGSDWSTFGWTHTLRIILCMLPANERRRYNVTSSLIAWAHTKNATRHLALLRSAPGDGNYQVILIKYFKNGVHWTIF